MQLVNPEWCKKGIQFNNFNKWSSKNMQIKRTRYINQVILKAFWLWRILLEIDYHPDNHVVIKTKSFLYALLQWQKLLQITRVALFRDKTLKHNKT